MAEFKQNRKDKYSQTGTQGNRWFHIHAPDSKRRYLPLFYPHPCFLSASSWFSSSVSPTHRNSDVISTCLVYSMSFSLFFFFIRRLVTCMENQTSACDLMNFVTKLWLMEVKYSYHWFPCSVFLFSPASSSFIPITTTTTTSSSWGDCVDDRMLNPLLTHFSPFLSFFFFFLSSSSAINDKNLYQYKVSRVLTQILL